MSPAIRVQNLSKTFNRKKQALRDVGLTIHDGEMVALIGASGSGKSTLIRHVAGLVESDRGPCCIDVFGQKMQEGGKLGNNVTELRRDIGVIFQQFNLVARLSVLSNVLVELLGSVPAWRGALAWFTRDEKRHAMRVLARVGIADTALQRANTLSGGQQQRAAIARALVQGARVILADEPIASLDPASAKRVMETLSTINREDRITIMVSLHQVEYARRFCPRTIAMRDGEIVFDSASTALTNEFLREIYGEASEELVLPDAKDDVITVPTLPGPQGFPVPADAVATSLHDQMSTLEVPMKILKCLAVTAMVTAFSFSATAKEVHVNKTSDGKILINVGLLATESQENLMKRWGPIIDLMAEKTGYVVKPFFASDYAGVIEGMRFNKVDLVLYGNKSAMEAVRRAGAEIFAQVIEPGGGLGYYSVLHTLKTNTKINSLDDVLKCDKSINFGIGDPNSTSGFLVPTTFIFAKHGVDPQKCFKTVRNASHETNLLSVANGQVDVATANNKTMHIRLKRNHREKYDRLKEIWRSPLIPSDPLAYRGNLPGEVKAKIFAFFVGLGRFGTPDEIRKERKILNFATYAGFKPSSNAQLFPIREMAINKDIMKIEADKKLSDSEKRSKIAELREQIKEIQALAQEIPNDLGQTQLMS